jgi:hemoglobin
MFSFSSIFTIGTGGRSAPSLPPCVIQILVTEMVCWASGGPQKYTGRSMADSHVHLKITGNKWEAFLDDSQQTLDKFAVPPESKPS